MRKKDILILIFMFISLVIINTDFSKLFHRYKMKYYIHILAKEEKVYIPPIPDLLHYAGYKLLKDKDYEKYIDDIEYLHVIEAMYHLRDLSKGEVDELLFSKHPNLRVYGYIYYLRKNQDVYFDYLLQSFECDDIVFLDYEYVYGDCYVNDVLLLIALKGINLPNILPLHKSFLYDLTFEQVEILKAKYEEKKTFNDFIDKIIKEHFKKMN